MPPVVIDLQSAEDERNVVHRAVQALAEGGRSPAHRNGLRPGGQRLRRGGCRPVDGGEGRGSGQPLTLAIKSADEARDFAPDMSGWPSGWRGDVGRARSRWWWTIPTRRAWSASSRRRSGSGLAAGDNRTARARPQVMLEVLRMLAGPLVLTSANRTGNAGGRHRQARCSTTWATGWAWWWTTGHAASASRRRWSAWRGIGYEILRAGVVPERTLAAGWPA